MYVCPGGKSVVVAGNMSTYFLIAVCMYVCMYVCICVCNYVTYVCMHTCVHAVYKHIRIHPNMYKHIRIHPNMYFLSCIHGYMHTNTHTHIPFNSHDDRFPIVIHTCMHTYIHTYSTNSNVYTHHSTAMSVIFF